MRKGFTLIELLLVVVIIGIVAALVLPKFGNVKDKAYVAAMKNDLRNLANAQEFYFEDYSQYAVAGELTDDVQGAIPGFYTTDGVTIELFDVVSADQAWRGVASHEALEGTRTCELRVGKDIDSTNKITCN